MKKELGYIDIEYGIKSSTTLSKWLTEQVGQDVIAIKVSKSVKIIWAIDNKLYTYIIDNRTMYTITVFQVEEAIIEIEKTVKKAAFDKKHKKHKKC